MKNKKRGFGYYFLFSLISSFSWFALLTIIDMLLISNNSEIDAISNIRLVGSFLLFWLAWLIPFIINKTKQGK